MPVPYKCQELHTRHKLCAVQDARFISQATPRLYHESLSTWVTNYPRAIEYKSRIACAVKFATQATSCLSHESLSIWVTNSVRVTIYMCRKMLNVYPEPHHACPIISSLHTSRNTYESQIMCVARWWIYTPSHTIPVPWVTLYMSHELHTSYKLHMMQDDRSISWATPCLSHESQTTWVTKYIRVTNYVRCKMLDLYVGPLSWFTHYLSHELYRSNWIPVTNYMCW